MGDRQAYIDRRRIELRGLIPNGNMPPESDPGTVGPPDAEGGDPEGFMVLGDVLPATTTHITPSRWSGYPDDWAVPLWNGVTGFGQLVDTAWAALDLNASILSTMPPYRVEMGDIIPPTEWMRNPDPDLYTGWTEFAKQLFWSYQLGEAFVLPTAFDSFDKPARFHVVEPWLVNIEMRAGRRKYNIGSIDVTDDILHIRYQSTTSDARGHGPLEAGSARLVAAAALARYATNVARSGGVPNSALVVPGELVAGQADALLHQWFESRTQHLGLPAVLSGGVDIKTLQISPKDMALVELQQLNASALATLLGVPPFLLGLPSGGDSLTYSTTESLFDFYWRAGLRPKASPVMEALSNWALPASERIELNRDEFVRPGFAERVNAWVQLHSISDETGIGISAEEIRAAERLNGDQATAILNGGN